MKKSSSFLLGAIIILLLSFTTSTNYELRKSTAEVQQMQGLYIFFASTPITENEYLGTLKNTVSSDGTSLTRLNEIIKKCKKKYPEADGLVFQTISFDRADAIKFKN